MPKHEQLIAINNTEHETAFAFAYSAMRSLQWDITLAGTNALVATTPKKWNNNPQQSDTSATQEALYTNIENKVMPVLNKATEMLNTTAQYDISTASHTKASRLLYYIDLRKQEMLLMQRIIKTVMFLKKY